MTDPTPNDLSPQGEHAPPPEPLSPDAMAVLDAFLNGYICNSADNPVAFQADRNGLAAALRAAADQVVPDEGHTLPIHVSSAEWLRFDERKKIRAAILAIATELEGHEK